MESGFFQTKEPTTGFITQVRPALKTYSPSDHPTNTTSNDSLNYSQTDQSVPLSFHNDELMVVTMDIPLSSVQQWFDASRYFRSRSGPRQEYQLDAETLKRVLRYPPDTKRSDTVRELCVEYLDDGTFAPLSGITAETAELLRGLMFLGTNCGVKRFRVTPHAAYFQN